MGRAALLLTVLTVATFGPAPAANAADSQLSCSMAVTVRFTPGISMSPTAQTFSGSGPIACARPPAAALAGTISMTGTTSPLDGCATGAGSGTFTARLGPPSLTVTGRFTFLRTGLVLQGPITLTGDDVGFGSLRAALVPLGQNCATRPIRDATVAGTANASGTIR